MNNVESMGISGPLLDWYEAHARDLPWRVGPRERAQGERPDPYRVWLSEIMLQQTTIAHGTRYFLDFTRRWPRVEALAATEDEDVMAAWAGLGYYARARNLLKCARVVADSGGAFPRTAKALQALPGIGPYTAGAIAAIAFDQPEPAIDGNVERVAARLLALEGEWKDQKAQIRTFVAGELPAERPGEFAEALMDIGATVCLPRKPLCARCPLSKMCTGRAEGTPERYPSKPKKAAQQARRGAVLVRLSGTRGARRVELERRPETGLLGGMLGLPGSDWTPDRAPGTPPPGAGAGASLAGEINHVFTHIRLTLDIFVEEGEVGDGISYRVDQALGDLPSVFAKALRKALGAA